MSDELFTAVSSWKASLGAHQAQQALIFYLFSRRRWKKRIGEGKKTTTNLVAVSVDQQQEENELLP